MKASSALLLALACTAAAGAELANEPARTDAGAPAATALFDTVQALDAAVFDAFNGCSDPDQLRRHAAHFAVDVEFYHDTGGVTWTRDDMLANTERYACGKFRRELVPGTLEVFPVHDFGAIARGSHRFCAVASHACEGLADFTMVWRLHDGQWRITRVLSYGHRPAD